jgi:hypothetical protein
MADTAAQLRKGQQKLQALPAAGPCKAAKHMPNIFHGTTAKKNKHTCTWFFQTCQFHAD